MLCHGNHPALLLDLGSKLPRLEVTIVIGQVQIWITHQYLPFLSLNQRLHILNLLRSVLHELEEAAILLKEQ